MEHSDHIYDAHIVHLLTMGEAPYVDEKFREKFKMNSFFIADNVRNALDRGIGDYTPIFLSEIPAEFETGRIPIDVALISVAPPDANGLCSLGVSVDIVQSAAANARYVIAQVNSNMPRTYGNSFLHVNTIDVLVPHDDPIIEIPIDEPDETLRGSGRTLPVWWTMAVRSSAASDAFRKRWPNTSSTRRTWASTRRCSATGSSI